MNRWPVLEATPTAGNGPAVLAPVEQDRRRGDVVVPEIVMNGLEVPDARPGVRPQRDDRVRKQVVAEPLAAEVVVARAARRHEHEIARRIGDDHRPGVGAARCAPRCCSSTYRRRRPPDPAAPDPTSISACPVTASKPRTSPLGCGFEVPSAMPDPTTIVSPTTAGGEVTS